jgi:hypothetical protein
VNTAARLLDPAEADPLRSLRRIVRLPVLRQPSVAALCAGVVLVSLFAAQSMAGVPASVWLLLGVLAAAGFAIAATEPRRTQIVSLNVFALALAMRVLWLVGAAVAAGRGATPLLGPDSSTYWEGAIDLVCQHFPLGVPPPT